MPSRVAAAVSVAWLLSAATSKHERHVAPVLGEVDGLVPRTPHALPVLGRIAASSRSTRWHRISMRNRASVSPPAAIAALACPMSASSWTRWPSPGLAWRERVHVVRAAPLGPTTMPGRSAGRPRR
jgi:hypothetical protein